MNFESTCCMCVQFCEEFCTQVLSLRTAAAPHFILDSDNWGTQPLPTRLEGSWYCLSGDLRGQEQLCSVKATQTWCIGKLTTAGGQRTRIQATYAATASTRGAQVICSINNWVSGSEAPAGSVLTAPGTASNRLHAGCVRHHFKSTCMAILDCN